LSFIFVEIGFGLGFGFVIGAVFWFCSSSVLVLMLILVSDLDYLSSSFFIDANVKLMRVLVPNDVQTTLPWTC
jgi:amino acid transporter